VNSKLLLQQALAAANGGVVPDVIVPPHGNLGSTYDTTAGFQYLLVGFWNQFYDAVCNNIGDSGLSPPDDQVKGDVYQFTFIAWSTRVGHPPPTPSLSTFMRASKHVIFANVVPRAKHVHTRCTTCRNLTLLRRSGFADGTDELIRYNALHTQHHQQDIRAFRELTGGTLQIPVG
jgi:hypothetical protein